MNIKSTQRAFGVFLPAEYTVMYTCYQRGVAVLGGVVNFWPFIIKRILGIKRILTRVYSMEHKAGPPPILRDQVPRQK